MALRSALRSRNFFSSARAATFLAVARRIVPDDEPQTPDAGSETTLRLAETFLEAQDRSAREKFALFLKIFEWGSVLKFGRRFTRLPAESQDAYLRAWEFSGLQLFRFAFSSLRNLVLVSFYTQPESWPMIGYPGPVIEKESGVGSQESGLTHDET